MPEPKPKRAVHNAGAFLTPDGFGGGPIPVPMSTLSDEYKDEPTEPGGRSRAGARTAGRRPQDRRATDASSGVVPRS